MEDMQEREFENPNSPWLAVIDVAMNVFGDLPHQPLTEDQLTTLEEENSNQPEDEF